MSKARNIADSFSSNTARGAYVVVQGNGIALTSRPSLNIINATVTDDSTNNRTNVTIGGVPQDVVDGGVFDSIASIDGGSPTSSSYTFNLVGGTV